MSDIRIVGGQAAAFLRLACGDFGVLHGVFRVGDTVTCPEVGCGVATTVTGVEPTEIIRTVAVDEAPLPAPVDPEYVRAGASTYLLVRQPADTETYAVHSFGRLTGTVQQVDGRWSATPLGAEPVTCKPQWQDSRTGALCLLGELDDKAARR